MHCFQYNNMSVYQKDINNFNLQVHQKISVRNHIDKEKIYKNKMPLIFAGDQRQLNSPQLTAKSPKSTFTNPTKPNNVWKQNEVKTFQTQNNYFQTASNFKKSMDRPMGETHYRTPSAAYDLKTKGVNTLNFDRYGNKHQGDVKLSLRTLKVNRVQTSGTRVATYGGNGCHRDQRYQTDLSYTPNTTLNNTEKDSDNDKSKYSLKGYNKKIRKPELLMNLKYEDLVLPAKQNGKVKYINGGIHQSQNSRYNISKSVYRNSAKTASLGCKCPPYTCWTTKLLEMIHSQNYQLPPRLQNPKDINANIKQIERDLHRTQPDHPAFKSQKNIAMLKDLLSQYAHLDDEVGYVQGMNFVGAALIYHCQNVKEALKILNYMMNKCHYRNIFLNDMQLGQAIAGKLVEDLRRLSFDLFQYLVQEGVDIQMFISSWYFSLCGSFVPLDSMHIFLDKFIKKGYAGINELIIAMLLRKKLDLMKLEDSQLMLQFSNQNLCDYAQKVDWKDLRERSDHIALAPINV